MLMKKLLPLLFVLFATMAQANTFNYLVFTNIAGTTTTFCVDNLTLTINENQMQVTNADGKINLTLIELQSMQFVANAPTALENTLNADAPVQVFSLSGTSLGTYTSLLEAAQHLNAGMYVISNGSMTQTIVVK